jgi:hypothetical protein
VALVQNGAVVVATGLWFSGLRPRCLLTALLAAAALVLSGQALLLSRVAYCDVPVAQAVVVAAAGAGFVLVALFLPDLRVAQDRGPWFGRRLLLLFLAAAVLRTAAISASPEPVIDVYTWLRDAPRFLLLGQNPYAAEYVNPYPTERALRFGFPPEVLSRPARFQPAAYPPLPILLALPCSATGVDVRHANGACELLAALALFLTAQWRQRPLVGALLAALYLNLPRAPLLAEQAWYEPMLAALLGWGLLLAERGHRAGYVLVGLGLTGKQFGVPLLPPLWQACRRHRCRLLLGIGVAGAVVLLPFFLWSPSAFLSIVLFKHLQGRVVLQTLTFHAALDDLLDLAVPRKLLLAAAGMLIAGITWRTPRTGAGAALWMGTALLVFCLCHQTGNFNYFYLCEYLLLLGVAGLVENKQGATSSSGTTVDVCQAASR